MKGYQEPSRKFTEFIKEETDDDEDEELPPKVKYSKIHLLQEEEYEDEGDDNFFPYIK